MDKNDSVMTPLTQLAQAIENTSAFDFLLFAIEMGKQQRMCQVASEPIQIGFND